jgi:hypothetical protein
LSLFSQNELAKLGGVQGVEKTVVQNLYVFVALQKLIAGDGGETRCGWRASWIVARHESVGMGVTKTGREIAVLADRKAVFKVRHGG